MERIKLTKNQKQVLRMVANGQGVCPAEFPSHTFNASVRLLQQQGLVKAAYGEGGGVVDSELTDEGRQYLAENPRLRNPIDWGKMGVYIAIASLIVGIAALFIACNKIG